MYLLSVNLLFILMYARINSINPDCRCYLFTSQLHTNGTFKSPNYNMIYGTVEQYECIVYTFKAKPDEIVHITFTSFYLSRLLLLHPSISSSKQYHYQQHTKKNLCSEYIRIYDNLQENELGADDPYSYELCGTLNEMEQQHYISKKNILIIEARLSTTGSTNSQFNGFTGKFIFEPKNRYTSDGQHVTGTICDRLIKSPFYEEKSIQSITNRSSKSKSGHFFSPNYPENYPSNIVCNYYLIGQSHERVILNLINVQIQNVVNRSSKLSSYGDYLQISEAQKSQLPIKSPGVSSSKVFSTSSLSALNSFYHSVNVPILQPTQIIQHISGKLVNDVQIISKGPYMLVTFSSNKDDRQSQGFEARYHFVHKNQVKPTITNSLNVKGLLVNRELSSNRHIDDNGKMDFASSDIATEKNPSILQEKFIQWDKDPPSGKIYSPGYPEVYPPNQIKDYVFVAPQSGKVRITVQTLQLDADKAINCRTHLGDRLEIYTNLNQTTNPWIVICGAKKLLEYQSIESFNEFLMLRFISDSIVSNIEKGFELHYEFTNFTDTVTTNVSLNTATTSKNISSMSNYRDHQESVQLESNLMDDNRYELLQNFNNMLDRSSTTDGQSQINDKNQNYDVRIQSSSLIKPVNEISMDVTVNNEKKTCSFIIEANDQQRSSTFQSFNLKDTLIKYHESHYRNDKHHESLLCNWMLIGKRNQRVQIRLISINSMVNEYSDQSIRIRRKNTKEKQSEEFDISSTGHSTATSQLNQINFNRFSSTVSGSSYNGPKIRCDTPYLIKIFNYRIQSTSINQPTYSKNYLFPRINHKSNEKFNNNNHNQFMNGLKSEEQITICLGSTLDIDLNRAIYMSGYIPRMNILLYRINYTNVGQYSRPITRPAYSPPSTSSSLSSLSASHLSTPQLKSPSMFNKYSFITYDIEYRFVYDYGVNKSHGKQISPDCDFSFHSSTSKSGFFTSPNYPGLYPVDIICEYRLVGYQNEVIDLEFQEFDVESNSVRCSTDGDGDYVEVRSCSTLSILDLGRKYYCQNVGQYKNNTIRINWRKSCLIIKFFSNNMIVRHGFLATYRFSISGANSLRGGNSGRLIQLSLLCLTFIHFCVFKTLQMKPLNSV